MTRRTKRITIVALGVIVSVLLFVLWTLSLESYSEDFDADYVGSKVAANAIHKFTRSGKFHHTPT